MDTKELDPIYEAKKCIDESKSFVLHGGAGSGKTESLKDLLEYMHIGNINTKVACITHTNVAVNELKERIGDNYQISTIHSFFYKLIINYKKNIKTIIHELYILPFLEDNLNSDYTSEDGIQNIEHKEYKKLYNKYANKLYSMHSVTCGKVIGKRDFDKKPEKYIKELNLKIKTLNDEIIKRVNDKDYAEIKYNQTKFNNLNEVSFGHDGLLDIVKLLFDKYPIFKKIISDRYNYIFIDEYQDTRKSIIESLLSIAGITPHFTLCLFGDSMQGIYADGIGNVKLFVESGILISLQKINNYRCSHEVLKLINTMRLDKVKQEVALAENSKGEIESDYLRHGEVKVCYSIYDNKPHARSSHEEKNTYLEAVETLISKVTDDMPNAKILLLTNKAVAEKEGFSQLYAIFNDRYSTEITSRMDDFLSRFGVVELCELCYNYSIKHYNEVIKKIKKNGYAIKKIEDKVKLKQIFDYFVSENFSLLDAINFAEKNKLIKYPESLSFIISSNERFLKELDQDLDYKLFKSNYVAGHNTYTKVNKVMKIESEGEFNDLVARYKKEQFINAIFSKSIKFKEAMNYFRYISESSNNITMHKTKGSSIESVIVVMEEYFWGSEYNFSLLYSDLDSNQNIKEKSQKLIYVACSRARKNLTCVRLIKPDEEISFCKRFPDAVRI